VKINKPFRISLLSITFGSAILVLGKLILFSSATQPQFAPFVFPEKVPLPQWQFSESRLLIESKEKPPELFSQKYYRYIQNDQQLDITMHYLIVEYVPFNNQIWTPISSSAIVRQKTGIGFYGLGVTQQRAYLSSCINPRGGSTFTNEQFNQNRYLYDLRPQYLLSWLVGKNSLLDRRCLWVNLSVSLTKSSPESAYQVLENAWFSWYQWWQIRFPQL
jgi:cyanosortase A-associated protein